MRRPSREEPRRQGDRRRRHDAAAEDSLRTVFRVAAEELVAAVPRQHDLDVAAGELRYEEEDRLRRLGHRLVSVPRESRQHVEERGAVDNELVMVGAVPLCRQPSARALVVQLIRETDREGGDAAVAGFVHEPEHCRRVDSSRKEHPDLHVSHQPPLDRCPQELAQVGRGESLFRAGGLEAPVGSQLDVRAVVREQMSRRELLHAGEERVGRADVALEQELGNVCAVE